MNCIKCGKKYHWCSSCGFSFPEDHGYCSNDCFVNSDEYKDVVGRFKLVIDKLGNKELGLLSWLLREVNFEVYDNIFSKMIINKLNKD